jgi:Transposase IS116/IS110/IS902 family.
MSLFGRAEARGQARGLARERNRIDEIAQVTLADHHDYRLLRRIPGIGPINALTILAEAGDLRRFGHYRQFLKFCGLDLATCQSGTFRGRTKLSRQCPTAPNVLDGGAGRRTPM